MLRHVVLLLATVGSASGSAPVGLTASLGVAVDQSGNVPTGAAIMRRESEELSTMAAAGHAHGGVARRARTASSRALRPDLADAAGGRARPLNSNLYTKVATAFVENASTVKAPESNGIVQVASGTDELSETQKVLSEEDSLECLRKYPVETCTDRYGSLGIRRLFDEPFEYIIDNKWERPDWMAHPTVQARRLFEIIFPMTHGSGSAKLTGLTANAGKGTEAVAMTQSLNIFQQLRLGVRALDFGVASAEVGGHLWVARGYLNVELRNALLEVKRFLATYRSEVVFIYAGKADLWGSDGTIADLVAEESDLKRIPGQKVHQVVAEVLGDFLATHKKLDTGLPKSERVLENPKVEALVAAKARVLYFWEGQQVLCTTLEECKATPGWERSRTGDPPFAFGAPMAPGERARLMSHAGGRVIEPLCVAPSSAATVHDDLAETAESLKAFEKDPLSEFKRHRPSCYPQAGAAPALRMPTVLHEADAYIRATQELQAKMNAILGSASNKFTLGESLTAKTPGERLNFLLLASVMRRREIKDKFWLNTQFLSLDFMHPIFVHRLVEYNQGMPECGFGVHCLETGSCFAKSRLKYTADGQGVCGPDSEVAAELEDHGSKGRWSTRRKIATLVCAGLVFKLFVALVIKVYSPYALCATPACTHDFIGCVCWRKSLNQDESEDAAEVPAQQQLDHLTRHSENDASLKKIEGNHKDKLFNDEF